MSTSVEVCSPENTFCKAFSEEKALEAVINLYPMIFLRYPNEVDTVTWTWNQQHGAKSVLWLTLTQPFSRASLEFLPVYQPSPEEIADPKLFGANVRQAMAKALQVPTSDLTYEEVKQMYGKKYKSKKRD